MASQHFYFDIWSPSDYTGTALGELSEASERTVRIADQSIGSGSFQINRHSAQAAWCEARALVRVRLVPGGPFAYNDSRYVAGFFIETSEDVALSEDEEGGEELTRGGPSLETILKRAVNYPNANITGHRSFWAYAKTLGDIRIPNRTIGEAFRILVLNAMQRTGNLPGLTIDFTITDDSSGNPWSETTVDWRFPVGMNLLEALSKLVSSKAYYRITPALVLSVYEDHPGADLSGSVVFSKGELDPTSALTEASSKTIDASNFMSRALVRGDKANNELTFLQVADTGVEAETGRVEGYVEYKTTPTTSRLTKAGQQAIDKSKLAQDGPVTSGVLSDSVPFVDYEPGDLVTVNIPDVYDSEEVRVAAITLKETEGGEYDVIHEYQAVPFDPASGPDNFASSNDAPPTGPGGGNKGCGDCPTPSPFVPPADGTTALDSSLGVGSVAFGYPSGLDPAGEADNELDYATEHGLGPVNLVNGRQYRLHAVVVYNRPIPFDGNFPAEGANANYGSLVGHGVWIAQTGETALPESAWTDPVTMLASNPYPYAFPVASHPNNQAGFNFDTPWRIWSGADGHAVDIGIFGVCISGYWGCDWRVELILQQRNGDGSTIVGEGAEAPFQGQPVGETATDPPSSGIYTTNFPYVAGSLRVWVSGVSVAATEVDNTAGTWQFPSGFDPGTGTITVQYQALNSTPTGATNAPWSPGNTTIPSNLLPSELFEDDKWKQPVRVATTANITIATGLNAGDTIDGRTLVAGDRVLVKDQSTASQNGIYVVDATPFRAVDFDDDDEVMGSFVFIVDGTVNGWDVYYVTNTSPPDVGTDAITFAQFAPATALDWGEDADISTLDFGDVPDAGALDEIARADHVHGMPATPTFDPADDESVWMPLTTVVGGDPELVWDADDSLIPTLTPLS